MSEQTKLRVFEQAIAILGCRFSQNALTFTKVDDETLVSAGAFLQAVDACSAWWWGDFLAAYCGYRLKRDEQDGGAMDELTKAEKIKQYGAHYAAICGKDAKTLYGWRGVAECYNLSRRREELSWSHHIEAKDGSDGDHAVADNWLDLAIKNGWSVSQLRAAIRRDKRASTEPEEPMPQLVLPMELVHARRYAVTAIKRVDAMDLVEIDALLAELAPILQLTQSLAAKRKELAGGYKESFSRAA